jgi:hypothetical protein
VSLLHCRRALAIGALAAIAATGWLGAARPIGAEAASSCSGAQTCRWTQESNNNWQPGSGSPNCSPCVRWANVNGTYQRLSYYNAFSSGSMWQHEGDWAVAQWSSLQYVSPTFSKCGCGAPLQLQAKDLGSGLCGWTDYSWDASGNLTKATVYLNSNSAVSYIDGPSNDQRCDLRNVFLHEVGHAFGEGHSSITTDLMATHSNNVETIDADAQNMMAAVYGTYGGCSSCQADIGSPVPLNPLTPQQIKDAIVDKTNEQVAAAQAVAADGVNIVGSQASRASAGCQTSVMRQYCEGGPPK